MVTIQKIEGEIWKVVESKLAEYGWRWEVVDTKEYPDGKVYERVVGEHPNGCEVELTVKLTDGPSKGDKPPYFEPYVIGVWFKDKYGRYKSNATISDLRC